jgi:hypothetical protein
MQKLGDAGESRPGAVTRKTRRVARSRWGDHAARVGLAARGVVFVLLGYLVARVAAGALGSPHVGQPASLPGVADTLDAEPGGTVVLYVLAVGLALYAMFSLIDTILHHDDETPAAKRWGDRALSAWGFVMYSAFSAYCIAIASSSNRSSESSAHDRSQKTELTSDVLRWPGGVFWLGLLAGILIGMAVFLVSRAVRRSFRPRLDRDRMSTRAWRWAMVLGTVGYLGRAGLFALVGGCVMAAAVDDRPRYGQGVNGAVRVFASSGVGPPLLGLLAAMLVVYGAYMFFETRYRYV